MRGKKTKPNFSAYQTVFRRRFDRNKSNCRKKQKNTTAESNVARVGAEAEIINSIYFHKASVIFLIIFSVSAKSSAPFDFANVDTFFFLRCPPPPTPSFNPTRYFILGNQLNFH